MPRIADPKGSRPGLTSLEYHIGRAAQYHRGQMMTGRIDDPAIPRLLGVERF
jgi:hypothetical protein